MKSSGQRIVKKMKNRLFGNMPLSFKQAASLFIGLMVLFSLCSAKCHAQDSEQSIIFDVSQIRIHAIAWSEDPAKRVAVVDDQILRQGMTFQDAEVVGIDPEKVIFQFQGRQFVKEIKRIEKAPEISETLSQDTEPTDIPEGNEIETPPPQTAVENEPAKKTFSWTGLSVPVLSNIRTEPNPTAPVKYRISNGKRLRVTGRQGDWLELKLRNGSVGWIHESVVEKVEP
jgi:SH3 domain-containing protein/type II secretion system (T2SS) protein B